MITEMVKKESNVIGRLGENEARVMRFHVGNTQRDFPGCSFAVLNRRPNDADAYPVSSSYVTVEGEYLLWTVMSGDLAQEGIGECEIIASVGTQIVKSEIYATRILHALDGAGTPPDPWESWVQDVTDMAERAEAAAELLENPGAQAETLAPGSAATVSYSGGVFTFGIPQGEKGNTGQRGPEGPEGPEGPAGQDGSPGADGFSPTASVSKRGKVATITITDAEGTTTAQVSDGEDGDPAALIDDTTSTATNKAWSAKKSYDEIGAKYEKPAGGIPGTDLADEYIEEPTTAEEKAAIQKLLGIPNAAGELIYETTLESDATEVVISADSDGQPFKVTKAIILFTAPALQTGSRENFYGSIKGTKTDGTETNALSIPTLSYYTATSSLYSKIVVIANAGMPWEVYLTNATGEGNTQGTMTMAKSDVIDNITYIRFTRASSTSASIPSGTNIKVYGIREYE